MRRHPKAMATAGALPVLLALVLAGCSSSGGRGASGNDTSTSHGGAALGAPNAIPAAPGKALGQAGGGDSSGGAAAGDSAGGTAGTTGGTADSAGTPGSVGGSTSQPRVLSAAAVEPAYQIRTATIELTDAKPLSAKSRVVTIVNGAGGFVSADDSTTDQDDTAVSLTLKVPPDAYDSAVRQISNVGKLRRIQQSTQDVTGDVVDVQSRLAVQKSSIARLRTLLDNAGDLGKIIQIESELTKREADLESMEGQLKALTAKTDLATVAVSITKPGKQPKPKPAAAAVTVSDGFGGGAHAFVTFFRWLGIGFGAVLPFAAAAAFIAAVVILIRRRLRATGAPTG